MRRVFAALMFVAAGLLAPATAGAQVVGGSRAPANGGIRAEPAPGSSLDDSSTGFGIILDPGHSSVQTLVVTNTTTDRRLTIRVQPVDASRRSDGIHYTNKATEDGAASWLSVASNVVVLDPGATENIAFTATAAEDAPAGDTSLAGMQVFAEKAQAVGGGEASLSDLATLNVPIARTIAGDPKPQLAVTEVRAVHKNGGTSLSIKLYNSGAVETRASGTVKTPGNAVHRKLEVTVPARKDITTLVPWTSIDTARGADVVVDLRYGNDDVASWAGNVGPAPGSTPVAASTGEIQDNPVGGTNPTSTPRGGSGISLSDLFLALLIVAIIVAAGAWFVVELRGGRAPVSTPIDPATLPPLQVVMDERHTEVLDALVTNVGVLGDAIGALADKLGVTVTIPQSPAILGNSTAHRHREPARPRHAPNPSPPSAMSERMAATRARMAALDVPAHDDMPRPSRQQVQHAISDAVDDIRQPPVFAPPRPPDDWLFEDIEMPAPRLITPPPRDTDVISDANIDSFVARHLRKGAPEPEPSPRVEPQPENPDQDFWGRSHDDDLGPF
jgi:hypothetical protein